MKTADLIAKAELTGKPLAHISRELGLDPNTLSAAKHAGRLSPAVAAALAGTLGEPVAAWTLAAVIEGERSAPLRRRLAALQRAISYFRTHAGRSLAGARFRPHVTVF